MDEFIPKFKGIMEVVTHRIILRVQENLDAINTRQKELITMRDSLKQSQNTLNQSQAGWAQTALDSLAQGILKTCKEVPNDSSSLVMDSPQI